MAQTRCLPRRGFVLSIPNIQQTRHGVWRYRKVVPKDLRALIGKREVLKSLGTRDEREAAKKALALDQQWSELFAKLRAQQSKGFSAREAHRQAELMVAALGQFDAEEVGLEAADVLVRQQGYSGFEEWNANAPRNDAQFAVMSSAVALAMGNRSLPKLSIRDALALYFSDRDVEARSYKFKDDSERHIERLVAFLKKDKLVTDVTKAEARAYFEWRKKDVAPATVNKEVKFYGTVFALAIREQELEKANPWDGLRVRDDVAAKDKRDPFTLEQARRVLRGLEDASPEARWIGVVTALTGARLAEVAGLDAEDVVLDGETPHIIVRPNAHRPIKTKSSSRKVPLVGPALDALREAKAERPSGLLFPQYGTVERTTNLSAYYGWFLGKLGVKSERLAWHSWRHTVKDLMRNADIPEELQRRILGHTGAGVSATYGRGPDMKLMAEALEKALRPLLSPNDAGRGSAEVSPV